MAQVTKNYTLSSGGQIKASEHNSNYDTIYNEFNGNIDNDNIKAAAGIVASKLDLSTMPVVGASAANSGSFTNIALTSIVASTTISAVTVSTTNLLISGTANIATVSSSNLIVSSDIYTRTWSNYGATSTIVGWSAYTSQSIYTKKIGKTVFVSWNLAGTSNSTAITFTLPDTAVAQAFMGACGATTDNTTAKTTAARYVLTGGTATVALYSDMDSGTWTNSGTKASIGEFWYESA